MAHPKSQAQDDVCACDFAHTQVSQSRWCCLVGSKHHPIHTTQMRLIACTFSGLYMPIHCGMPGCTCFLSLCVINELCSACPTSCAASSACPILRRTMESSRLRPTCVQAARALMSFCLMILNGLKYGLIIIQWRVKR
jgi:hypothetical protein